MTKQEYKAAVIELFRFGKATDEQWQEMAGLVLTISEEPTEDWPYGPAKIDETILGPVISCPHCGEDTRRGECWECGEQTG